MRNREKSGKRDCEKSNKCLMFIKCTLHIEIVNKKAFYIILVLYYYYVNKINK